MKANWVDLTNESVLVEESTGKILEFITFVSVYGHAFYWNGNRYISLDSAKQAAQAKYED